MFRKNPKVKKQESLNEALGISRKRLEEIMRIMAKSRCERNGKSAVISYIFTNPEFTEIERLYLCFDYGYISGQADFLKDEILEIHFLGDP